MANQTDKTVANQTDKTVTVAPPVEPVAPPVEPPVEPVAPPVEPPVEPDTVTVTVLNTVMHNGSIYAVGATITDTLDALASLIDTENVELK